MLGSNSISLDGYVSMTEGYWPKLKRLEIRNKI